MRNQGPALAEDVMTQSKEGLLSQHPGGLGLAARAELAMLLLRAVTNRISGSARVLSKVTDVSPAPTHPGSPHRGLCPTCLEPAAVPELAAHRRERLSGGGLPFVFLFSMSHCPVNSGPREMKTGSSSHRLQGAHSTQTAPMLLQEVRE